MKASMQREERQMRDAAFAELLASLRPENALKAEMIAARVRAGLTQAQLAERMGTSQPAVAEFESGRSSPNLRTLRKLAEATGSRLVVRLDATTEGA